MTIYSWFSHKKWWFSIAMWNYERIKLTNHWWVRTQLLTPFLSTSVQFDPHDDPRHRSPAFLVSLPCCKWSKLRRRGRSPAGRVFFSASVVPPKYIGIATKTTEQHVFFSNDLHFWIFVEVPQKISNIRIVSAGESNFLTHLVFENPSLTQAQIAARKAVVKRMQSRLRLGWSKRVPAACEFTIIHILTG